jgi:cation diffusion facilitator CzcD-associated flavoprotein CzcO
LSESVDVAIVGAGQAGLSVSWFLKQAGVDHVVLDGGRIAETWRSRRWDSFCLVTPNWSIKLPGGAYQGPDPDGFMPLADLVEHFESWAKSFQAPVREKCTVSRLDGAPDGGFRLSGPDGEIRAGQVVVASGAFQRANRPAGAEAILTSVEQLLAEEYHNPEALAPGAVVVVGSGQTGCQLAEELHQAGRRVFLACGRSWWVPRRLAGRDFIWWMAESGFMDRTPDMLPSPAARLFGNPQATGHDGGYDLHFRTLHAAGVELLGRFAGADESMLYFADDLAASVDFGDTRWADFRKRIDAWCLAQSIEAPLYETPVPMRIRTRLELDVAAEGITTIIWTAGYRADYGWVKFPIFDDMGLPIQTDGRTSVQGLYFSGVQWLRKSKSSILYGIGEDAEVIARQILNDPR